MEWRKRKGKRRDSLNSSNEMAVGTAVTTTKPPSDMDILDRKLLNVIQSGFPLVDEPYVEIGEQLGIDEAEVLERLARLRSNNVVRQISAIFDTRRLGYKTTLVAMAFPPEGLHAAALVINEHPGVSHNYAREGSYYNLWFTIAVAPDESLEETVDGMAARTGALQHRLMPTIRFFKIGVNFNMVDRAHRRLQLQSRRVRQGRVEGLEQGGVAVGLRHSRHSGTTGRPADDFASLRRYVGAAGTHE